MCARPASTSTVEPRWLTDAEQHDWRSYLQGSAVLLECLGRVLQDRFDLSLGDYELMVRLSEAPDNSLRMSQLAAELVHSRSRVTYAVRTMEARGLVTRCAAPLDGRGVVCTLTTEGQSLLAEAAKAHVQSVRDYFVDVIGAERLSVIGEAMAMVTASGRGACAADGED